MAWQGDSREQSKNHPPGTEATMTKREIARAILVEQFASRSRIPIAELRDLAAEPLRKRPYASAGLRGPGPPGDPQRPVRRVLAVASAVDFRATRGSAAAAPGARRAPLTSRGRSPRLPAPDRTPSRGPANIRPKSTSAPLRALSGLSRPSPADPTDLQSAPPTGQSGDDRPSKSGFPGLGPA